MARVLFYTGITLLAISAALLYLPTCFSVILAVLFGAALIVLLIFHRRIRVNGLKVLLLFALIFTLLGVFLLQTRVKPAEQLTGFHAEVVGTVVERPDYRVGYTVYEVKCETITLLEEKEQTGLSQIPQNLRLRLSDINSIDLAVFDRVRLAVSFRDQSEYRASSLSNGIYAGGYVDELIQRMGTNRPFYAVFYDLQDRLNELLYNHVNYKEATVVSAVLLGDRSRLDTEFTDNAKAAGVSHMLVVSGMHLGIIFQILGIGFTALRIPKRLSSLFLMAIIFAFAAICGFTPSILRAGLTYFILALGWLLFLKPDPLNSLGAATVIIFLSNPFSFGNIALLLSLSSTFGLLFLCPVLYARICGLIGRVYTMRWFSRAAVFSFCQTLSATLFTMPISILTFGYFSVIAPLTNLCIGYAMTLILALALLTVLLLLLPSVFKTAAAIPIILLCLLIRYVVTVVNAFSKVKWAVFPTEPEYLIPWLFLTLALCFVVFAGVTGKRLNLRRGLRISAAGLLVAAVFVFSVLYAVLPQNRLAVLDVGKGSCVVLRYRGDTVVIGAGDGASDAATLRNYLLSVGEREIDCLVLPNLDKSLAAGAAELVSDRRVKRVLYPLQGDYYDKLQYISDDRFAPFAGEFHIAFPSGLTVDGDSESGTVARLGNSTVIVYTSDGFVDNLTAPSDGENRILVCINGIPQGLDSTHFSRIILSGSEESVAEMRRQIKDDSVEDAGSQTVVIGLP